MSDTLCDWLKQKSFGLFPEIRDRKIDIPISDEMGSMRAKLLANNILTFEHSIFHTKGGSKRMEANFESWTKKRAQKDLIMAVMTMAIDSCA